MVLNLAVKGPISVICDLNDGTLENGRRIKATIRQGIKVSSKVSSAASTGGYVLLSSVSRSAKKAYGPESVNIKKSITMKLNTSIVMPIVRKSQSGMILGKLIESQ